MNEDGKRTETVRDQAEREDEAREVRGMVKGLKALGKSLMGNSQTTGPSAYPDPEATDLPAMYVDELGKNWPDRRHEDIGWTGRPGPVGSGAQYRATDGGSESAYPAGLPGHEVTEPGTLTRVHRAGYQDLVPVPGPWAGVAAALEVLRPTGRYDRVTDDAWRLVNAFCEARAQDPETRTEFWPGFPDTLRGAAAQLRVLTDSPEDWGDLDKAADLIEAQDPDPRQDPATYNKVQGPEGS